jgi:hypothetical protein
MTYPGRLVGPNDPPAHGPQDITMSKLRNAFYARNLGSYHPGVTQFVMADSGVRPIQLNIDLMTYGCYGVRDDGIAISAD